MHIYISQNLITSAIFQTILTNLSRSFCKCCLSPSLLTFIKNVVSSTNFSTLLVILLSKSFIYIKNSKGSNTDPCGTPLETSSLKPPHLLQHAIFCQSIIFLSS